MKVKIVSPGSCFDGRTGERVEKVTRNIGPSAWWVKLDGGLPVFPLMFNESELEDAGG